jgi:Arc/MetJ family transcription regulator
MRLHISLDDDLVGELDSRAGVRGRSAYIEATLRRALDDERRWEQIASAVGAIRDHGHEWDDDVGGWVRSQREADPRRVG